MRRLGLKVICSLILWGSVIYIGKKLRKKYFLTDHSLNNTSTTLNFVTLTTTSPNAGSTFDTAAATESTLFGDKATHVYTERFSTSNAVQSGHSINYFTSTPASASTSHVESTTLHLEVTSSGRRGFNVTERPKNVVFISKSSLWMHRQLFMRRTGQKTPVPKAPNEDNPIRSARELDAGLAYMYYKCAICACLKVRNLLFSQTLPYT